MLQSIREHTQGWIAGAIISIIILTFALWGIHSYFEGGVSSVVASVNGVEISKEQLTVAYERLRRQIQSQQGSAAVRDDSTLKERALKSLVDVEALKQASAAQGFLISNDQIDNYLQNMPEFQVDGQFSVERFQEVLSSTLMTTGDFLDVIKTGLQIDQPRLGIALTSFALPEEAKATISLVNQEREIEYINIPKQLFLTDVKDVDPAKINTYYDEHRDEFMTPEQVSVDYLELSTKNLYSRFNPTETELKSFYNENINSYTRPMEWKLAAVLVPVSPTATQKEVADAREIVDELSASIKKEGSFDSAASKYPGKSIVKDGFVSLNEVPAELQKATAVLTNAEQISAPVRTSSGFVILKAVEIRHPQVESFEVVQQKVKDTWLHQHAEEKFAEMRERLADLTYEHPESLKLASDTLQLPVKSSELFTKDKTGKDIAQYKKIRDVAFSNDVLSLQNNSDVIQVSPDTVVVLRVKSHIPSSLLPLKDISVQISDKLKNQEAVQRAEKFAEELSKELHVSDPAIQQALAAKNLTWMKAGYLGRYSTKVDTAILDLAFRLPNPAVVKKSAVFGVTRIPNGFAVVALKAVKDGVADSKQLQVFSEQVQNSDGFLEYELYKQSQMNHARIKINS